MPGRLITVEGIEGAGKTTQIGHLAAFLRRHGLQPLVTREPGGTRLGERIRRQLLDPLDAVPIHPLAELLLFLAARAQHLREIVEPALAEGTVVLCDRFRDATTAYQGQGRGLSAESVDALHRAAGMDRKPDLTLLLDCEVPIALERIRGRVDGAEGRSRFDREEEEFHRRVRQGYLRIAAAEPDRVRRIDASRGTEAVRESACAAVAAFLALPPPGE